MSLYIQEQITQELHDLAFNKCYEELEGTPKFLTLMEEQVEMESEFPAYSMSRQCYVSKPVQGDDAEPNENKFHELNDKFWKRSKI
ncbi:hypothetical protein JCGZ_03256 [Jatropha curcas]|uniref:Uncharacterized protein n=1 Tax=Jatropha curcas TaxID=180498 RepID=A0A067JGH3_JATCU|nr:hypothetical protein JCGZ_03256 [Jatropha curcas]